MIEPKLKSTSTTFEKAYRAAHAEPDSLMRVIALSEAQKQAEDFYNVYYIALGIVPEKAKKYLDTDSLIQHSYRDNKELRHNTSFSIQISGDDTGRIQTKLTELLSKSGFSLISRSIADVM